MGKILSGCIKFVCLTFLFFIIIPFASALPTPEVTFIPSNISVNSSFLLVVDPKLDDSIRVTWLAYEVGAFGQVPKIGNKWVCYFSDTDTKSTCGPDPFRVSNIDYDPYTFEVNTTDNYGNVGGKTLGIYVGGIELEPDIIVNRVNRTVDMVIYPSKPVTGISYTTYYASNITLVKNKNGYLTKQVNAYVGKIGLDLGEYYIAFEASSGDDYGGAVARVDMRLGLDGDGEEIGYVDVDPVSLNILINKNQRYEKSNFKITNLRNQTLTGMSVRIPRTEPVDVNDFLDIELGNDTLAPYSSMYFSVILEHVVNSMEIKTQAELKSNESLIGYIPIDIRISVKNESGTAMVSCEDKSDMSYCYGGICCDEVCREKSNCCDDIDCASDERCEGYRCVKAAEPPTDGDFSCITGTCYPGYTSCPAGMTSTGYECSVEGEDGVCCEAEVNECLGQLNGTDCTDGVCCNEECLIGECCEDIDCPTGYVCTYNYCTESEAPEFDLTLPIIIVIIILAVIGVWFYFKKYKKKGLEEEFEEGAEEFEEEFY